MYAEDLIKILEKLPPDTIICKTSGEEGCAGLESAKYFPQYNILYLEPYWGREYKGYIDMADGDSNFFGQKSRCPYSKEELLQIRDLARKGKKIVDAKADGKMHRIRVIPPKEHFFALEVDGEMVEGSSWFRGQTAICDFEWKSLKGD